MTAKTPKYPDITVKVLHLRGDNAAIIIECLHAMKNARIAHELPQFAKHVAKAAPGQLIDSIQKWFNVE